MTANSTSNPPLSKKPKAYGAQKLVHVLIVLSVLAIVVFAVLLLKNKEEVAQGGAAYSQLRSRLNLHQGSAGSVSTDANATGSGLASSEASASNGPGSSGTSLSGPGATLTASGNNNSMATTPSDQVTPQAGLVTGTPVAPDRSSAMDFTQLLALNQDVVGWIWTDGTSIDYPVVRGKDNDYYLRHLVNGEQNQLGTPFMDYRNAANFTDRNTVIYGHHLTNETSMFASLTDYRDQAYYDLFPSMLLYTPGGDYKIEFFAGIIADGNNEFIRLQFSSDDEFLYYVATLKAGSTFKSNVDVKAGDRIISLITCTYEFDNARFALFGKLVPIN